MLLHHDVKSYKRLDGVKKATDKLTKEEIEALDELSKKALAAYAHKAVGSARASGSLGKDFEHDANRALVKGNKDQFDANAELEKTFKRQATNRVKGVRTAVKKLAKEEVVNEGEPSYVKSRSDVLRNRMLKRKGAAPGTWADTQNKKKKEKPFRDAAVTGKARDFANEETSFVFEANKESAKFGYKMKKVAFKPKGANARDTAEFEKSESRRKVKEETIVEKYEGMEHMSDAAHELVLHGDNHAPTSSWFTYAYHQEP